MSGMMFIFVLLAIGVIITLVVLALTVNKDSNNTTSKKTLFKTCKNNFECETGFFCELRNHPSDGICVIPPGGACHKVSGNKSDACYSGYYCDVQDGICLKKD
jgi:hypothetical protein